MRTVSLTFWGITGKKLVTDWIMMSSIASNSNSEACGYRNSVRQRERLANFALGSDWRQKDISK